MKKSITIPGTNIEITVNNADEMNMIYQRLHGWNDLVIDGEMHKSDTRYWWTRSAFEAKYFAK